MQQRRVVRQFLQAPGNRGHPREGRERQRGKYQTDNLALGAAAVVGAELAGNLTTLIVAQFIAGGAWGCMLMSAVSAALAIGGGTGAPGKVVGLVFSALALATFARMAAVAGGLQKLPEYAPLLHWAPVACWSVAGAGLLVLAASRVRQRVEDVPTA